MTKMHKSLLFAGAALGVVLVPSAAFAQDAGAAGEADSSGLEEIVVTADRTGTEAVQVGSFRGARQLDVPLTISVIPKSLLDGQQAVTLSDALRNSAGVTSSQITSTFYSSLAIRGIDVDNRGNYRLNGSLPIVNLVGLPLENKERVEALKGASALYYGFTTPSGIINMVMERPTETPTFSASIFGNAHGQLGGSADYGNTFGDGLFGARINAVYAHLDSGIDNTSGRRSLVSGAFDLKPTDNLTISFDAEYISNRAGEPATYRYTTKTPQTVGAPNPAGVLPEFRSNKLNFGAGDWMRTRATETNLLLAARWKFADNWELSGSVGQSDSYRYRKSGFIDFGNPLGGDNYNLTVGNAPRERNLNKNIRAELAGVIDLGFVKNNILIGASQNVRNRDNPNTVNTVFVQNIENPLDFTEVPFANPNYGANDSRKVQVNDIGFYIFNRVSVGSFLDLLGGVRFSDYTEKQRVTGVETFSGKPTSFSYGAVVKPLRSLSIYGTYIEGLEATPLAPTTANNSGAILPPSESRQYEAGIKYEPKPGVLLTASYFDINRGAAYVNGNNDYVKDGRQVYRGFEFSATGQVTPELTVYATGLLLNAKYKEGQDTVLLSSGGLPTYLNTATNRCTTTVPGANAAALRCQATTNVGNRVDGAPRSTFSLAADYRFTSFVPGLIVNAAAYYVGKRPLNPQNYIMVPSYTTYNLGLGYNTEVAGTDTTFRLTWENVGDKRYWATTGQDFLAQGAPSTVKFSITTNF